MQEPKSKFDMSNIMVLGRGGCRKLSAAVLGCGSHPGQHQYIFKYFQLVGLCYEVHDTWQLENDIKKSAEELGYSSLTKPKDIQTEEDKSDANAGKSEVRKRTGIKGKEALNAEAVKSNDAPVKPVKSAEELHEEMLLRMKYEGVTPTLMEVVHYSFNYCGVLTG